MAENVTVKKSYLRTKTAVGYALILLLIGGIVHIWLSERRDLETLKAENERISGFRKEIQGIHVRIPNKKKSILLCCGLQIRRA